MIEKVETFEDALVDVILFMLLDKFEDRLKEELRLVIQSQDPKALRQLVSKISKG